MARGEEYTDESEESVSSCSQWVCQQKNFMGYGKI